MTDLLSIVDFTDARDKAATGHGHVLDRQFDALGVTLDVVPTERYPMVLPSSITGGVLVPPSMSLKSVW